MDAETDYTFRSLFADGLELASRDEEGLSQLSTRDLEAAALRLRREFPGVAVCSGYAQGIDIILAQRKDDETWGEELLVTHEGEWVAS